MDKISRDSDMDINDVADKLDELVRGYNETWKSYNDLELRYLRSIENTKKIEEKIMERLDKIEE